MEYQYPYLNINPQGLPRGVNLNVYPTRSIFEPETNYQREGAQAACGPDRSSQPENQYRPLHAVVFKVLYDEIVHEQFPIQRPSPIIGEKNVKQDGSNQRNITSVQPDSCVPGPSLNPTNSSVPTIPLLPALQPIQIQASQFLPGQTHSLAQPMIAPYGCLMSPNILLQPNTSTTPYPMPSQVPTLNCIPNHPLQFYPSIIGVLTPNGFYPQIPLPNTSLPLPQSTNGITLNQLQSVDPSVINMSIPSDQAPSTPNVTSVATPVVTTEHADADYDIDFPPLRSSISQTSQTITSEAAQYPNIPCPSQGQMSYPNILPPTVPFIPITFWRPVLPPRQADPAPHKYSLNSFICGCRKDPDLHEVLNSSDVRSFIKDISYEMEFAVNFIIDRLCPLYGDDDITESQFAAFREYLGNSLFACESNSRYLNTPMQGSAYNWLKVNANPSIQAALQFSGIPLTTLAKYFPQKFSVWVTEKSVSFQENDSNVVVVVHRGYQEEAAWPPKYIGGIPYDP